MSRLRSRHGRTRNREVLRAAATFEHYRAIAKGKKKKRPPTGDGRTYRSRDENLRHLGFPDYAAYLASDLWSRIRRTVTKLRGDRCVLCGQQATQFHHNRYCVIDLSGLKTKHIHPVCRTCHELIEYTAPDVKRTMVEAVAEFNRRLKIAVATTQQDPA